MGKGSKQRPSQISKEDFNKNWDKIFGNKEKKDKKVKKDELTGNKGLLQTVRPPVDV
jgi:hypothetical protein